MNKDSDYIIDRISLAISELVFDKWELQKAYNYYNGKRDPEQFRYLEENFGIGNPTSMEFTPLIKKHVDAITGEYLDIPIMHKVSCKDKNTITKIHRDLQIKINEAVFKFYKTLLNNRALEFIGGKNPTHDLDIERSLDLILEEVNNDFISEFEIAAQNVIEYCIQSRYLELKNKLKLLIQDLLIAGCAAYRVKPTPSKTNLQLEVLNILNLFVERNPNSPYIKDCPRCVYRRWLTKSQILQEFGEELSKEGIEELNELHELSGDNSYYYVRSQPGVLSTRPDLDGTSVTPGFPSGLAETTHMKMIPVYEVEWIETDKEGGDYVQNRYEGVRIGQSIYIARGKSKNIIRSIDDPTRCTLSVNGIIIMNRDLAPQSLVLQCAHLQDKYDVVIYLRDNVLANSGTVGDWVDISMLPTVLGSDLTERLEKFIAHKKAGVALIDSSQEGRAFNNNTTIAGYDDSVKVNAIQAFELVLARIEEQVSSITGVFRERLNGITQRDAVSNVEAGARNSYIITKPFYQQMDTLTTDILIDCLNVGKIVWKEGLTGTLILGDKLQKTFTALPEHFTLTDYDVHIVSSTQILKDIQKIEGLVYELIRGSVIEPDTAVDAIVSRSLTEMKDCIKKSWANLGLQIISYLLKVLQFWLYVFRIYFELIFVDCMKYISSVIFYMNIHLWPVMSVEWIVFSLPQYLKSAAYIGVCLFLESPVPLRYLPIFTSVPYCHEHPDFISLKAQTVSFSRLVLPVLGSCTFV